MLGLALGVVLAGVHCGAPERSARDPGSRDDPHPWIDLSVAGVPPEDRRLLITPPSDFPIDVSFPVPEKVMAESVIVSCIPWSGAERLELRNPVVRRRDGATFAVPRESALSPGSHTLLATVWRTGGGSESVALDVAVRRPRRPSPLSTPQWIQLDFDVDRDGDPLPDFPTDLAVFGLASGISPAVDLLVEAWVIDEIVARAQAFYDAPNPSGLPDGDPIAIRFSADPPAAGPFTRICVGGATPGGEQAIIGNVLLDPGNSDPSDEACDDFLPSGVFPREITHYEGEPTYREAFDPLTAAPAGSDPLDLRLLGGRYDSADPGQKARREVLRRGVETFAQVVASVAAHEAGHAMGLVPPGPPGRGLFGGEDGVLFTHDVDAQGSVPRSSLLMNPGPSLSFEALSGVAPDGPLRLRALDYAYLQGRLLLDPAVDGIYMPPRLSRVEPQRVDRGGPPIALLEISGSHFRSPPDLRLRGLARYGVPQAGVLPGRDGGPDVLVASLLTPGLLPGVYAVELTNPDGQSATLEAALEIR